MHFLILIVLLVEGQSQLKAASYSSCHYSTGGQEQNTELVNKLAFCRQPQLFPSFKCPFSWLADRGTTARITAISVDKD
jgi:hypothetical protein